MESNDKKSRRDFVKASTVAAAAGATVIANPLYAAKNVHVGSNDELKVGLIGCGGRGSQAAINACNADSKVVIHAMADAFMDRIAKSERGLKGRLKDRYKVAEERKFTGWDCHEKMAASDVDVVLLCTPPHFRPMQMEAAVKAGKHIFCEKPVAVDPVGVRRVRKACEEAKKKKLNVVSGLCWRYDIRVNEVMKRIKDGAIGDIMSIQENYLTGTLWHRGDHPRWSDMEYQMRNWLYYTWLSGDLTAEQHIHSLDKGLWLMDDKPPKYVYGVGGRQVRTGKKWGNVYDHFACCYDWENGVKMHSYARQMKGCFNNVDDYVQGTKGSAKILSFMVESEGKVWKHKGRVPSMYDVEHQKLFEALRSGEPINNGGYMCDSTLMAIAGRHACYTGERIEFEQFANLDMDLSPENYDGEGLFREVAMPGSKWPSE